MSGDPMTVTIDEAISLLEISLATKPAIEKALAGDGLVDDPHREERIRHRLYELRAVKAVRLYLLTIAEPDRPPVPGVGPGELAEWLLEFTRARGEAA